MRHRYRFQRYLNQDSNFEEINERIKWIMKFKIPNNQRLKCPFNYITVSRQSSFILFWLQSVQLYTGARYKHKI